jgi:hypothetical protein
MLLRWQATEKALFLYFLGGLYWVKKQSPWPSAETSVAEVRWWAWFYFVEANGWSITPQLLKGQSEKCKKFWRSLSKIDALDASISRETVALKKWPHENLVSFVFPCIDKKFVRGRKCMTNIFFNLRNILPDPKDLPVYLTLVSGHTPPYPVIDCHYFQQCWNP